MCLCPCFPEPLHSCQVAYNNRHLFCHRSRGQKSNIKVLLGPCSFQSHQGRSLPGLFQLLAALAFLGLCSVTATLPPSSHGPPTAVSVSLLFIRMAVIQDEGHTSLQYDLIFNYTCIVPIFKWGHIQRFQVDLAFRGRGHYLFSPLQWQERASWRRQSLYWLLKNEEDLAMHISGGAIV